MKRVVLVLGLVACGGHGESPPGDAPPGDPAVCTADFEAEIDRSCMAPSECVLVDHADCCGIVRIGIRAGTEMSYPPIEARYETCLACPPTGCAHADQAEDGSTPQTGQAIVADCIANRCTSLVR